MIIVPSIYSVSIPAGREVVPRTSITEYLQFLCLPYITNLSKVNEECMPFIVICQIANRMSASRRGPINLEAKLEPNFLNTAIYLIGLFAAKAEISFLLMVGEPTC